MQVTPGAHGGVLPGAGLGAGLSQCPGSGRLSQLLWGGAGSRGKADTKCSHSGDGVTCVDGSRKHLLLAKRRESRLYYFIECSTHQIPQSQPKSSRKHHKCRIEKFQWKGLWLSHFTHTHTVTSSCYFGDKAHADMERKIPGALPLSVTQHHTDLRMPELLKIFLCQPTQCPAVTVDMF